MDTSTAITMKVNAANLLKAIAPLSSLVAGKPIVPILKNFLFDITPQTLTITGSDLYTSITTQIPITASAKAKIAVPGTILIETLRNIPDQPLDITLNKQSYSITLHTNNGQYQIACENHVDFPQVPITNDTSTLKIQGKTLKKAFKQTGFATGKDEMFPRLNGVNMTLTPQNITFAATDGHRLVRYNIEQSNLTLHKTHTLTVPNASIQILLQIIPDSDDVVHFTFQEKHFFLKTPQHHIVVTIIDEEFPDYESIIPEQTQTKTILETKALQKAIRLIDYYASELTHEIAIEINQKELCIQAENLEFSNRGEMRLACNHQGEGIKLHLHASLFAEMIKNIPHESIILHLQDSEKAIVITPEKNEGSEELLMLIMPISSQQA